MRNVFVNCLILITIIAFTASCQYKFTVEPVIPPIPPGDSISFSLQIVPMWADAGCTDCHKSGGQSPYLTAGVAYTSITSAGLVNTAVPAESIIYSFPSPDSDTHTWKKYTASQAALVLQWIEKGAKNN
jgi:hypothetical protein